MLKKRLLVGILLLVSGCTGQHGWEVKFGVNPITQVNNTQSLHERGGAIMAKDERHY